MRFTSLVLFLLLLTTNVVYAVDENIKPDVSSLDVTHSTKETTEVYGMNDSRIIIKTTIVCEIRVKLLPSTPLKLYSVIVDHKKAECPLVPPKRRPRKTFDTNPERPA